ncbi:MAG: UDP-N-acetylmuramoyl-L-alanyl-D-glutamate--2,6-diaminopimelate ligase [Candidatus Omnitrophica bacterium]|nr:UDP-N-acetylmuramoyl-L-alanyl-D-glutamate--2,6-diaminopimelate ligase [Candidatus Omnitrophota bacterium]
MTGSGDRMTKMIEDGAITRDNIKTDSREVGTGDVFVALKGTVRDGHDLVGEAADRGASAVIVQRHVPVPRGCRMIEVENTRKALGRMASLLYGDPSRRLNVTGVTGTNGKTTTVFLIDHVLNHTGRTSGFLSTVSIKTGTDRVERAAMTTPDSLTVNRALGRMADNGLSHAVVEVSSHALSQERIAGIELDAAVFTNLSPEHLDYHCNMDDYFLQKKKIFSYLKPGGKAVLNIDDKRLADLSGELEAPCIVTFGIEAGADLRAENMELGAGGSEFDLCDAGGARARVRTTLTGLHNVYNILGAAAALRGDNMDIDTLAGSFGSVCHVPGRLEAVASTAPFRVFVDYAHTPDALRKVLECLRPLAGGKLICVFGCGGDRDKGKRPLMGRTACELCDDVLITDDNPRTEPPGAIIEDIKKGVSGNDNYSIIRDRAGAIRRAIELAGPEDIVVIAGKGHENYQIRGDVITDFCDFSVAGSVLEDLGYRIEGERRTI